MADPTADLRQQLADHEADKTQNVSLTLATVEDCRRKQGDGTVGTRAVPYGSGLHARCRVLVVVRIRPGAIAIEQLQVPCTVECKLTSRPRIQKQTKQEDTTILATIQNFRRRQERYRPKQTQPTFQGRRCGCGLAYNRMWVWFRAHAHKNCTN